MTSKKANLIASPDCPPPYLSQPEISEKNRGVIALFLLAGPLPFLYSINSVLSLWRLDSFHYILFQAVFFALYPSLTRKSDVDPKLIKHDDSGLQLIQKSQPVLKNPQLSISNDLCSSSTFSEITLHPDSPIKPEKSLPHRFSEDCEPLFNNLQDILNINVKEDPNNWEVILETNDPLPMSIFRDKNSDHRYRLDCTFSNSPAAVFDSLSLNEDSASVSATNKVLKVQEKLEVLDSSSSILYFMSISVWPTSARDVCLLQSSRVLPDGSIISVLKSVPHESKAENSGAVRMDAHLAGRWFRPVAGNSNLCKMMGYFHGDLKGWVPKSLVNLAATKFVPKVIYKINKRVAQLPYKELPQSISSRFIDVGSSLTESSGSTICDEDVPDTFSISDLKIVKLEPVSHEEQIKVLPNEKTVTSRILDHPPTFWERLQVTLSLPWSTRQLVTTAGPVLLTAAVVAVIANRNQS